MSSVGRIFGRQGVLARDAEGLVQCHQCGEWFHHLGAHSWQVHELRADDYRRQFGLAQKTKLASERYRQGRREIALKQGLPELGVRGREKTRTLTVAARKARVAKIEKRVEHELNRTERERILPAMRARGLGAGGYSDDDYARWAREFIEEREREESAYGVYERCGKRWGLSGLGARYRVHEAVRRGLLLWIDEWQKRASLVAFDSSDEGQSQAP